MTSQLVAKRDEPHARRGLRLVESFERVMAFASWILAAVYLSSLLLSRFWLFELMTHFRVQLSMVMLAVSLGLLCGRRGWGWWKWFFAILAVSAIWSWMTIFLPAAPDPAGRTKLRILSANVQLFNERMEEFERLVDEVQPDIIAVLEYTKRWDARSTKLRVEFPNFVVEPRNHGFGIALFSKLPLQEVDVIDLVNDFDGPTIQCQVEIVGRRLAITALHAMSPLSSFRFKTRNDQFVELARLVGNTGPRVVLGDFNATTWSPFLSEFLRATRLRDSRQGIGLQPSWPQFASPLLIPIDHAFVSEEVHVHRRWVERDIGSDHYPIVIEISVAPADGD